MGGNVALHLDDDTLSVFIVDTPERVVWLMGMLYKILAEKIPEFSAPNQVNFIDMKDGIVKALLWKGENKEIYDKYVKVIMDAASKRQHDA